MKGSVAMSRQATRSIFEYDWCEPRHCLKRPIEGLDLIGEVVDLTGEDGDDLVVKHTKPTAALAATIKVEAELPWISKKIKGGNVTRVHGSYRLSVSAVHELRDCKARADWFDRCELLFSTAMGK